VPVTGVTGPLAAGLRDDFLLPGELLLLFLTPRQILGLPARNFR